MDPNNLDMMSYLKIKKLVEEEEEEDESAEEDEEADDDDADDDVERESSVKLDSQLKQQQQQQKKKRLSSAGEGGSRISASCLVESCHTDLTGCKKYYQRHRVCEVHAKAPAVSVDGIRQRFCQQCSRFHETTEFDQTKRSCRRRLAGHNERRRKSSLESQKNGTLPRHLSTIQTKVEPRGHKDFEILYKSL